MVISLLSKIIAHLLPDTHESVIYVIFENQFPTLIQFIAQFILIFDTSGLWNERPARGMFRKLETMESETTEYI